MLAAQSVSGLRVPKYPGGHGIPKLKTTGCLRVMSKQSMNMCESLSAIFISNSHFKSG